MVGDTPKAADGAGSALWMSTFAFTACFAVWTIFSIIGVQIKQDLGLSEAQFGLLAGTPILTGSLSRVFLGVWTDQYGGRLVSLVVMLAAALATFLLSHAHTYPQFLLAALGVGLAGGSFAVGVAYVSKFFPKEKQGTALGIFGAGNVGAAVTKFIAPFVMIAYGWVAVAQIWAGVLAVVAVVAFLFTRDDPQLVERRRTGAKPATTAMQFDAAPEAAGLALLALLLLRVRRVCRPGPVAAALSGRGLWPGYQTAGMLAVAYSVPASLFRVFGGWLSDRIGARRVMYLTFSVSALCTFLLSYPPTTYVVDGIDGPIDVQAGHGPDPLHGPAVQPRVRHEPGQGRGLQAHPGLLPGPHRFGRRPGRHDRRSGRLHSADRLRRC